LGKIREVGVPSKAGPQWLKTVGFKSSNDPSLLTVLRFIGFVDTGSVPTEVWRNYRGAQHGQVLANAIRAGYTELFSVYPDANTRSASDIEHVVSTTSSAGKQAVGKTVRTFQNLCAVADFTATGAAGPTPPAPTPPSTALGQPGAPAGGGTVPSLHIDIQVHISPEATADQIDKIFESMSKHLYKTKK